MALVNVCWQHWMYESDGTSDSVLKHKPIWATYNQKWKKEKKRTVEKKKQGDLHRTYGTRVIPVFVLSLADMAEHLMMEDESLVWTSKDVVIVLQHQNDTIPLRNREEACYFNASPTTYIDWAGFCCGWLSAPYEKGISCVDSALHRISESSDTSFVPNTPYIVLISAFSLSAQSTILVLVVHELFHQTISRASILLGIKSSPRLLLRP